MLYDYLVVGAGLYGSVFAQQMKKAGCSVLLIDKNSHVAGHVYDKNQNGVMLQVYGPHIFRTCNKLVWDYVSQFTKFNNYQHKVKAISGGKIYSLPYCMATFNQLWGCIRPDEAKAKIAEQIIPNNNPQNFEEMALSRVGRDIYKTFLYGYTKKQWQRDPKELPASIASRLPLRFTYNDNYFNDPHQGIPVDGYTAMIKRMIDGVDLGLNLDFFSIDDWHKLAHKLVFSGPIDKLFDYCYGDLEYLTLRFEHMTIDGDFQGTTVVNYTDESIPFTRVTEHKHFLNPDCPRSIVTHEFPDLWHRDKTPYYPVVDDKNRAKHLQYMQLVNKDIIIGGRLGNFQYYNMDQVIGCALQDTKHELEQNTSLDR